MVFHAVPKALGMHMLDRPVQMRLEAPFASAHSEAVAHMQVLHSSLHVDQCGRLLLGQP